MAGAAMIRSGPGITRHCKTVASRSEYSSWLEWIFRVGEYSIREATGFLVFFFLVDKWGMVGKSALLKGPPLLLRRKVSAMAVGCEA